MLIADDGTIALSGTSLTDAAGWKTFAGGVFRACGRRGATIGRNAAAARQALADLVTFFDRYLK